MHNSKEQGSTDPLGSLYCRDPERSVRWGPNLSLLFSFQLMRGEKIKIPL